MGKAWERNCKRDHREGINACGRRHLQGERQYEVKVRRKYRQNANVVEL